MKTSKPKSQKNKVESGFKEPYRMQSMFNLMDGPTQLTSEAALKWFAKNQPAFEAMEFNGT